MAGVSKINAVGDNWECDLLDVNAILGSVASALWRSPPQRPLPMIEVFRDPNSDPLACYDRGPNGEFRVRLHAAGMLWNQLAFQFGHELAHILSKSVENRTTKNWFDESICEVASRFVLRKMAMEWRSVHKPKWRSYVRHLEEYATGRRQKGVLLEGVSFPCWYQENVQALHSNCNDRDRNNVVATVLLPLFELDRSSWECVSHLNDEPLPACYEFERHLQAWRRNCPKKHRAFVTALAGRFEISV